MADHIDLMIKLFDTLKQASDKNESSIISLIQQQDKLIGHIEHLPIKDLQDALKEHNKDSKKNIDSCTETVETTSDKILDRVKGIENKIGRMILVVIVAFTLFSSAVFIAKFVYNDKTDKSSYSEILEGLKKWEEKKLKEHTHQ